MTAEAAAHVALNHTVEPVVSALAKLSPGLPDVMVVGATARDFLHTAAGHDSSRLRATDDLDIAIAVHGWDHFNAITNELKEVTGRNSTIRYRIAGVTVDIVPFGDQVESPDGVVAPTRRSDSPMSVFGFQDVWGAALQVQISNRLAVRVPTVAGYTVLKLKAWVDRSVDGQYKDGNDLATAMFWYQKDPDVERRLYDTDEGNKALEDSELDEPLAAVRLLISEARNLLSNERQLELASVWEGVGDGLLAEYLANPTLQGWPHSGDRRLASWTRAIRSVLTQH